MRRSLVALLATSALLGRAAACTTEDGARIVVTTNILGDVVREITGDQARVTVLMKPNADPHSFAISAREANALRTADLIVFNGLGLEEGVLHQVEAATAEGVPAVEVGARIDFKIEPDAELERPENFSLIDTTTDKITVVPMPKGVSYTFRSLNRGPKGEALILGTDGRLHVTDPATAKLTASWPVVAPWTEPTEWQQPRPALFVRGDHAYITEPAAKKVHQLDLTSGKIITSATLEQTPNEISGTVSGH